VLGAAVSSIDSPLPKTSPRPSCRSLPTTRRQLPGMRGSRHQSSLPVGTRA